MSLIFRRRHRLVSVIADGDCGFILPFDTQRFPVRISRSDFFDENELRTVNHLKVLCTMSVLGLRLSGYEWGN